MSLEEFLGALVEHNSTGKGYQVQLNSGNLDKGTNYSTDVEFGDMYFTNCMILTNTTLCFDNSNRKPIDKKDDGTNIYPMEINSQIFLDLCKIETIENVADFDDWFQFPSEKVINIYLLPEIMNGCRNVITIGFMS